MEIKHPLINIITRTSKRPKSFDRCVNSVINQTYKNVNHIAVIDDKRSLDYIKRYNTKVVSVNRQQLIKADKSKNPNTGKYCPHNLYMNNLDIKEGWVIYLDDDDFLINKNVLQEIVNAINNTDEDTIIYWQMQFFNGVKVPTIISDNNPPRIMNIGSPCFTFHSKYLEHAVWDGWRCSDFRVAEKLHKAIPEYLWIPKVFVAIPSVGFGDKKDVELK